MTGRWLRYVVSRGSPLWDPGSSLLRARGSHGTLVEAQATEDEGSGANTTGLFFKMISESNTSHTCQQATWRCLNTHPRPGLPAQAAQRAPAQRQGPPPHPGPGLPGLGLPRPGLSGPSSAAGPPPHPGPGSAAGCASGEGTCRCTWASGLKSPRPGSPGICCRRQPTARAASVWGAGPFAIVPVCTAGGQCQRRDMAGVVCAGGDPALTLSTPQLSSEHVRA